MHVLYFHQHFSTPQGSAGTRSYEMSQALIRAGHSVTVVCGSYAQGKTGLHIPFTKGRRRGVVDGIDVIEFDLNYGNHMGVTDRIRVFIKFALDSIVVALREPSDIIFATTTPLTAGIPGIFARWLLQKPFVFEVRDLWPEIPKAMSVITNPLALWLMSVLEWVSYRSADRLIGLSPGIVDGIQARGIDRSRIAMIPNGCDMRFFSGTVDAWRPKEIKADNLLAVFTGTHGQANGLDAVLDAAKVLKHRGRGDIQIVFVGQGGEKSRLEERARDEMLENVFFLDPIPKTRLVGLLAGADIGLQVLKNVPAFYYGTSPNKFFDYVAAGLPVANNYPGWLADLIAEHEIGFAFPPDDSQAFADALEHAANDRRALAKKGENATGMANTFSRDILSAEWVSWVVNATAVRSTND